MSTFFYVIPFATNGSLTAIPVPTQGSGQESYNEGFTVNYEQDLIVDAATALPISRPQFNQLMFDVTNNIQQYQILGTPYWITAAQNDNGSGPTPYPYIRYARVAYDAGSGMQIWESQVNSNTSTPGADANWLLADKASVGNPPGTIIDFGGTVVPSGYLDCDGSSVLITDYPDLYAAIGSTWGTTSSGRFLLPSLSRYVCMGSGGSSGGAGTPGTTVGSKGGSETTSSFPNHSHGANIPVFGGSNGTVPIVSNTGAVATGYSSSLAVHTGLQAYAVGNTDPSGTGASAPIVQPSAVVLKCIKY